LARNTIYVVGAGASCEAGLPTGEGLKGRIADLLNMRFECYQQQSGDYEIFEALKQYAGSQINEYAKECRHISANMPLAISIDNFIDTEKNNDKLALCGKLAIVKSILQAEKDSLLYFDKFGRERTIDFSSLDKTWYLSFFRTLTENSTADQLKTRFSAITLVIFNYDRCIEHFLLHALMSYYRLNEQSAAELINCLKIIHPYGVVGSLKWQDRASSTKIEFGGEIHLNQLINYAERIRTFTEGALSEQIQQLHYNMEHTERLVFLGFVFHRLNMELLDTDPISGYENALNVDCYATAFETAKSDQGSIHSSIQHLYQGNINISIENISCGKLFADYSRSLGYA